MVRLLSFLAHLVKDRQGNFGLLTAFLLVPLVGVVGLAIDISQLGGARTQLQVDLDAAVLSGANTLVKGTATQAKADVESTLRGLAGKNAIYSLADYAVTIDTKDNLVSATASGVVQTSFMRALGLKTIRMSTASQAKSGQEKYYEISLILDKSASMLLAATSADQAIMQKLSMNCVFACHDTSYAETYQGVYYSSYYAYARAKNVLLRADVQTQAVKSLMDTIDEIDPKHNHIKIDLFTLGTNSSASAVLRSSYNVAGGIRRAYGPTYDTAQIRSQLATNKELTSETSYVTSDFRALSTLNSYITTAGDGRSAATPLKVVLLITDGVQSSADWVFSGNSYITPLNPAWCSKVKGLGATFSVLYTAYLPWTNRSEYNTTVGTTMSSSSYKTTWGGTLPSPSSMTRHDYLPSALASCATSPEFYISAASPTDIQQALKTLVSKSLEPIRLTQ